MEELWYKYEEKETFLLAKWLQTCNKSEKRVAITQIVCYNERVANLKGVHTGEQTDYQFFVSRGNAVLPCARQCRERDRYNRHTKHGKHNRDNCAYRHSCNHDNYCHPGNNRHGCNRSAC